MGDLGIERKRLEAMAAKGKAIQPAFLDAIINRLLQSRHTSTVRQVQMSENEIRALGIASREIFLAQPNFFELEAPMKISGNIGKQSIETICLLLAYKVKYPENFSLLRGNHECASINRIYGFYAEWKAFNDCFNCLPVAALVDEKILCMHGGLLPDLHDFDQIRTMPRPTDVPETGLLCDLLWSDPSKEVKSWGSSDRGVSYTFGLEKVTEFLMKLDLDLVCRGHQVMEDGYEFFANRQLVTIFSAPNFLGEFDNSCAIMSVDDNLMCTFLILKPTYRRTIFVK